MFDGVTEIHECPTCEQNQDESECYLGRLGTLTHYRCRYCGMQWSEALARPRGLS
jgi:transposase-like protein